ncbi:MAG: DMT family transporter [Phycisphaeraceae bacterium]|nr:DMT family transporter [Phycisphaerales bacterium]MCB9861085.1 DMT family transporter [Phycisphaeraceae bacterium]
MPTDQARTPRVGQSHSAMAAEPNAWQKIDGTVTILVTLIGWSSVPLFLKFFADKHIDFWTSNGWRYGFSALLWLPVIVIGLTNRTLPKRVWKLALIPAMINAGSQILFTWAHYKISPGLLTFGLRSNIVFAAIGAAIFFAAERKVIGIPEYLLGILLVILGTTGTVVLGSEPLVGATLGGVLLAVGAGAGFAAYALSVRHFMQGINAIRSFSVISLYTAAVMVTLMVVFGEQQGMSAINKLSASQFVWLLVSAVIGIALGHVFYYHSINRLGLAISSGVVQLQPVFVSIASFYFYGEVLSMEQWQAGLISVFGAVLVLWCKQLTRRRDPWKMHGIASSTSARATTVSDEAVMIEITETVTDACAETAAS